MFNLFVIKMPQNANAARTHGVLMMKKLNKMYSKHFSV